jgi:hypothetical protein
MGGCIAGFVGALAVALTRPRMRLQGGCETIMKRLEALQRFCGTSRELVPSRGLLRLLAADTMKRTLRW